MRKPRPYRRRRTSVWRRLLSRPRDIGFLAGVIAIAVIALLKSPWGSAFAPSCNIRGNISQATGERIYHMPGQKYFVETSIRGSGERWFCTEAEALKAGWRRSKV